MDAANCIERKDDPVLGYLTLIQSARSSLTGLETGAASLGQKWNSA
jgi:hypothetical protein